MLHYQYFFNQMHDAIQFYDVVLLLFVNFFISHKYYFIDLEFLRVKEVLVGRCIICCQLG